MDFLRRIHVAPGLRLLHSHCLRSRRGFGGYPFGGESPGECVALISPLAFTFSKSTPPSPVLNAVRFRPASASLIFTPPATVVGGGGLSPSAFTSPNLVLMLNFPFPRETMRKPMTGTTRMP